MWIHSWRWKSQRNSVSVLGECGVYKMDDEGMDGFSRFVENIMVEGKERLEMELTYYRFQFIYG